MFFALEKERLKKQNFEWQVIDKKQVLKYLVENNYLGIEVEEVDPVEEIAVIKDISRDFTFTLKLTVKDNKITGHELY